MLNEGVGSWTARRARMSPGRVAVVYGGREWTYGQLHERASRLAGALGGLGVRHGDRVAYLGPNHPAFLETLFATGQLGGVFVPLNWRLAAPELAYILSDSGTRVLVFDPEHASTVDGLPVSAAVPADESLFAGAPAVLDQPVHPDETCMILYTSGTTGRPKGVMLTHDNVTWNSFNLLLDVDLSGEEVTLVAAPMFHVAALNQTVLPTLLKGGRVVLVSRFDPQQALDLIARHRVTFLFGVPTMFLSMSRAAGWAQADLSSVRSAICGGAPVPRTVIEAYQRRGVTFMQGYGLTEAAPGVLFLRRDDSLRKAGSAGTAAFFTDVKLVDAERGPVAAGEPGEILASGPNVMAGYWRRPQDTEAAFADGWLRTGDIGVADDEGYIEIRDRTKDLIISGGENIYPAEVEDALYAHPAVAECGVIGVPDETWGEVGRAVVVLREGANATVEELLEFLAGRIAKYKIPKSVVFTDALPRTTSGKVIKKELRARFT
ncbi:acyl-CoA synthetase [Allorhizocola rhizosphaerae]|uniref:acyl-CoA synthetase n=1 Tax=Allorhizocola rhizosphaerae TaxID=1872709 RepID=UPI000E3B8C72|nr:long-chain fatty acid--CoA ligase [Allorhizocola rhizosphaerae]